jgi:hypothetical protein
MRSPSALSTRKVVDHQRVVERAAAAQALGTQHLHVLGEAEGARTRHFAHERHFAEIHFDRVALRVEHRVAEFDGEADLEAVEGLEANLLVAAAPSRPS